jgi:hypothetical protein
MDYKKLLLLILGVLFFGSGILGLVLSSAILIYSAIIFGFAFLIVFRILWIKWQAEKIKATIKKSKINGYIYLIVLVGLVVADIIYKIYQNSSE